MIFQTLKFRMAILSLVILALGIVLRFGVALPLTKEKLRQQAAAQQLTLATYIARDIGREIATPIRNADHSTGALPTGALTLNSPRLLQILHENAGLATGGLLLVAPQERVFIDSASNTLTPIPALGANRMLDQALAGHRGTAITVDANGVEELMVATNVPDTNWFVIAHMPTAQAFQPLRVLENVAIQGSLLGLAGILVVMLLILPRMLRPLTSTARAMREIADGKRELKPLPVQRNDEIGSMVLGFNYLLTRLGEKEAALKESEIRLSFLAHHDSLTGLYNRAMLEHRLQQALDRAVRNGTQFALLFCDLDGFKEINDLHGHKTGDIVLTQVANRLQGGRKHTDTIARLGGDEFVVLLAELGDARAESAAAALYYLEQIGKPYQVNDKTFTLSVSIGVALYHDTVTSGSQLLSQADIAMYRAKHTGKDGYCFFEESLAQSADVLTTSKWITASRHPGPGTN